MLDEVRPGLGFWLLLGPYSSLAWLYSSLNMNFLHKIPIVLLPFVCFAIIFSWSVVNVLVLTGFLSPIENPRADSFFRGYKRIGKIVGSALLFFGNIGLYYYSEKSVACMLTFLFLAFHCLCALFCIQPYTDFGLFQFLLSASLNQALSLFGIHSFYSWLVLIACIVMVSLRYWLEPKSKFEMGSNSNFASLDRLGMGSNRNFALPVHNTE